MSPSEWIASFAVAFAAVLVVVEPFGAAPTFAALTAGYTEPERRAIAFRASLVGAAVLAGVALFGAPVLELLGVRLDAFRAAGGLLLLLTAFDMLRGKGSSCRCSPAELRAEHDDVAIVPLAVPLLSGPGSMATVMVLVADGGAPQLAVVLAAVAATFAVTWLVLRVAVRVTSWAGPSGIAVIQRVLGLVLASLAVQFIATGASGLLGLAAP